MIDLIIEYVPWWVFVLAVVVAVAALAYATFIVNWLASWMFWLLLGTLAVGALVGVLKNLMGGGV